MPDSWMVRHFSVSNPRGAGQDDVAALLRRVADRVSEFGPIEIMDITFMTGITEDGAWPSVTIYFHLPEDQQS